MAGRPLTSDELAWANPTPEEIAAMPPSDNSRYVTLPDNYSEPIAHVGLPKQLQTPTGRALYIDGYSRRLGILNDPKTPPAQKDQMRREIRQLLGTLTRAGGDFRIVTNRYQTDPSTGEITGKIGYSDSSPLSPAAPDQSGPAPAVATTAGAPSLAPSHDPSASLQFSNPAQPLSADTYKPQGSPLSLTPSSMPSVSAPSIGDALNATPSAGSSPSAGVPAPATTQSPSFAPSHTPISEPIAAQVAKEMETRDTRYGTGGVKSAFDDPTPLRSDDPHNDLMERLTDAILNPRKNAAVHIPFSRGETIALGILGGASPQAFQNVVMPLIQSEFAANEKGREMQLAQQAHEQAALQSLVQLKMEQQRERETRLYQQQEIALRQRHEDAYEGALAAKANAGAKLPPTSVQTYLYLRGGGEAAQEALALFDKNTSPWYLGGAPGGSIAGRFQRGPGAAVRNELSAKYGLINDAILAEFRRRSTGEGHLAEEYAPVPQLLNIKDIGDVQHQKLTQAVRYLQGSADFMAHLYPDLAQWNVLRGSGSDKWKNQIEQWNNGMAVAPPPPPAGSYTDPTLDTTYDEDRK